MKLSRYIPLIPAALVLGAAIFSHGCANTTTPPTGGPKDTIPPVLRKVSPAQGSVRVPVHKTKLAFTFNEYVKIKDPKAIYLSPPLDKAPRYKMKDKTLIVYFESDLDSNTTYTLDLNNAVVDNNEGNPYPGFTLVFSTGDQIDSMLITGTVQDCNTLQPVAGATVMAYKDFADSAVFLHRPNAAAKTDEWGFFCIRNIQDTCYRLYAIKDENNDNIYNPDNEKIAFLDSAVIPRMRVADSLPELQKYDMKDTLGCMSRHSEVELNLFREKPSKQFIVKKERVGLRSAYLTFMAPYAEIRSLSIRGIKRENIITQFNKIQDSLEIWVNDQRKMPDTLRLKLNYLKTDSLGVLQPTDEEVRLVLDRKLSQAQKSRSTRDLKHEDTLCVFKSEVAPETVEQYGFSLEFQYPLIEDGFDSLTFRSVNPKQKESIGRYRVIRDPDNLRRYTVMPEETLLAGYDYYLKIPHRKFRDINGFYNDSTEMKVSLPTDENLSTLLLNISGVNGNEYIVDLLNEKRDKVLRTYFVDADTPLVFPYLKEGKYCIRITEDPNRNGIVDTGSVLEHRQPEKVKFFKLNDRITLDIPARSEIEQAVDILELFKD